MRPIKKSKPRRGKEIRRFVATREQGGSVEYLVRWVGQYNDSWEDESFLTWDRIKEHAIFLRRKTGNRIMISEALKPLCSLLTLTTDKCVKFIDKRNNWSWSGYVRGLDVAGIAEMVTVEGEQCSLVQFQGQADFELLRLDDMLKFLYRGQNSC